MPAITLRQLEVFAQVVKLGSFRRCAEHLGIAQVVVSEHIRALERGLGRPMFERKPGEAPALTDVGRRAYVRASRILEDMDELADDVSPDGANGRPRPVVVGAPPFLMGRVQDGLAALAVDHPEMEITVDLSVTSQAAAEHALAQRTIDLGYVFTLDDDPGRSERVGVEPLAIFVPGGHPLAEMDVVRPIDLKHTPAIHLSPPNPLRMIVDQALARIGVAGGPIAVETDDYGLILTSVRRGMGYVCMFQLSDEEAAQTGGLKRLTLETPLPSLDIRRLARRSWRDDILIEALVTRLDAAISRSPTSA